MSQRANLKTSWTTHELDKDKQLAKFWPNGANILTTNLPMTFNWNPWVCRMGEKLGTFSSENIVEWMTKTFTCIPISLFCWDAMTFLQAMWQ